MPLVFLNSCRCRFMGSWQDVA